MLSGFTLGTTVQHSFSVGLVTDFLVTTAESRAAASREPRRQQTRLACLFFLLSVL